MDDTSKREDLRRKLREKIKGKRSGPDASLSNRMKSDPASTMLAMGLDDPELLKNAKDIVRDPQSFLKTALGRVSAENTECEDEGEEEAPPV